MIWIISVVSIIMALIFLSLGLMDILNENKIIKEYKFEAFFLMLRYLFLYPFIKLPFIINANKDQFGIAIVDDKGQKKTKKQVWLEVWAVREHFLKNILSNYPQYITDMVLLSRKVIKSKRQLEKKIKTCNKSKMSSTPPLITQPMLKGFSVNFAKQIASKYVYNANM